VNPKLKQTLEQLYDLCDTFDSSPVNPPERRGNKSTRQILELDLMAYVMYLSASDGHVSSSEARYVGDIVGCYVAPDQLANLIKENDIYSTEFEQRPPISLQIFVRQDKLLIAAGKGGDKTASEILCDVFGMIGVDVIKSDNDIAANERADFEIYFKMMKKYIDQQLHSGIQKSAPAQNTLKSQYQILKKKVINEPSPFLCDYRHDRERYLETILYIETDRGSGTGFVIHPGGYAVTCAHVVKDATEIYARIGVKENAIEKAKIISYNAELDLAIIQIEGRRHISAVLDIEGLLYLGDEISILGYPFGSKVADNVMRMSVSYTRGYISSIQTRNGHKCALLDISAKAGNSGSPVINCQSGKVVGVLSGSILGGVNNREEVNYMIPITSLLEMMED